MTREQMIDKAVGRVLPKHGPFIGIERYDDGERVGALLTADIRAEFARLAAA